MRQTPAKPALSLAAAITSFAGPCGAVLTETGNLGPLESVSHIELWFLVGLPAFGVALGIFSIYRGAKVAGFICLLTNTAALAFFGLIVAFLSRWH